MIKIKTCINCGRRGYHTILIRSGYGWAEEIWRCNTCGREGFVRRAVKKPIRNGENK